MADKKKEAKQEETKKDTKLKVYTFTRDGITVEAKNYTKALEMYRKQKKEKESKK